MILNQLRCGNFTSSEIVALTTVAKDKVSFGAPALTYIEEKNMERRLGRSLDTETNAKPLVWGKLLERYWFNQLGMEYRLSSTETKRHPTIPYWSGSADGTKPGKDTVIDIKSPITLKSFCQLVDPLYKGLKGMDAMNSLRDNHKDGDKYYWQLVSNSILENTRYAELIVGCPYLSELHEIKSLADGEPNCYWITMGEDRELPYLPDGGYYQNINVIRFEVPKSDKDLLTDKVLKAGAMLEGVEISDGLLVSGRDEVLLVEPIKIPLIKL